MVTVLCDCAGFILHVDSKKISLQISIPDKLIVFADENMINTVIRNLISNAAKFTNENGKIKIVCKQDNNNCLISISDNGIGIEGFGEHELLCCFSLR